MSDTPRVEEFLNSTKWDQGPEKYVPLLMNLAIDLETELAAALARVRELEELRDEENALFNRLLKAARV